nr:hypothetical protein [Tanacetum cinerariifolium]
MAKDDPTLTTMRFISKHESIQKYGAILPNTLTNQAMKDSDAYKTYYDFTIGNVNSKTNDKDDDDDQDDEQEEGSDQRTHTPSHLESTDDEAYDEVTQRDNVGEEKLDEENTLNIESTSLVDVPVTTNDEIPPLSVTTLPPPPIPLIQHVQQTSVTTPTIASSTSLQNLPTFGSLFKFEDRIKSLEDDFLEFNQTNLFVEAVSSIPGTVDKYLANQMNETIKAVVQLQSDRLRDEVKGENEDFVNKIDENIKKIIKEQVKDKLRSKSLKFCRELRSQRLSAKHWLRLMKLTKTSLQHMEILSLLKDVEMMRMKMMNPSLDQTEGQNERKLEKNLSLLVLQRIRRLSQSTRLKKGPSLKQGLTEDHLIDETTQLPDWFQKPSKPPTSDCDWNMTLHVVHGPIQPLTSTLAQKEYSRESFNELIDTPLDFSAFVMNRLKVDTLTPELLTGLTFELMKGSYKSLVELEYFLEEVYKANMDQLDSNNPEG